MQALEIQALAMQSTTPDSSTADFAPPPPPPPRPPGPLATTPAHPSTSKVRVFRPESVYGAGGYGRLGFAVYREGLSLGSFRL